MSRLLPLLLLLTAACSSSTKQATPRRDPGQVFVFLKSMPPPKDYRVIKSLSVSIPLDQASEAALIHELRKEAGAAGAEALIVDSLDYRRDAARATNSMFGTSIKAKGKGRAIQLLTPDPRMSR